MIIWEMNILDCILNYLNWILIIKDPYVKDTKTQRILIGL